MSGCLLRALIDRTIERMVADELIVRVEVDGQVGWVLTERGKQMAAASRATEGTKH